MQRNVTFKTLGAAVLLCLPVAGLLGQTLPQASPLQTPPQAPPAQNPLGGASATATQTPSTAPLQTGAITIPPNALLPVALNLRAWLGLPTTAVNVNGSIEQLGISTGLNANTLSPATVTRLQIPEGKTRVRVNILDREADALETVLKTVQFGLLKLENMPVAQVDVVSLLSRAPHPDAPTGWLGLPFLSAFTVTLDMSRRTCVLDKPQGKMPSGAIVVPMILREGRLFVSMTLPKSKPFPALLDTSAVLTLIPASVGEKLKLPSVEVVKLGGTAGKEVKATLIQAPTVAVGKAECKAMRVAYLSAEASPGFDRDTAVLGLDFLSRYRVVLNFTAKKVAFLPLVTEESATKP
jgi:hypothetical protein